MRGHLLVERSATHLTISPHISLCSTELSDSKSHLSEALSSSFGARDLALRLASPIARFEVVNGLLYCGNILCVVCRVRMLAPPHIVQLVHAERPFQFRAAPRQSWQNC